MVTETEHFTSFHDLPCPSMTSSNRNGTKGQHEAGVRVGQIRGSGHQAVRKPGTSRREGKDASVEREYNERSSPRITGYEAGLALLQPSRFSFFYVPT